jgi:outer membrane protein
MKKQLLTAIVLASSLLGGTAFAQAKDGPWLVRVRAVGLNSANTDNTSLGWSINNKTIGEVDASYFIDKNIAFELMLTAPQEHTVSSTAAGGDIGTFTQLPTTLMVQYHFDTPGFKPYVGAGLNYTHFSAVNLTVAGADIDRSSVGAALQVGVDIPLSGNMYLNLDLKKIYSGTEVSISGVKQGSFNIDPVLFGVGLGWRF